MDEPLDLCLRTSQVREDPIKAFHDFKRDEQSLSVNTAPRYEIEDNEKMVQRWLQHMPADRMISTEYSPYLQTNQGSTSSRISFDPNMSSDASKIPGSASNRISFDPNMSSDASKTNINVKLHNKELWRSFSQEGTEMIINRSGRLMYPRVEVTVEGLNASSMYSIGMTVIPVDDKRYKYKDNVWSAVGKSEIHHPITPYKHPISPATGSYWTKDILSFGHAKLSNHLGPNKICLESMHKYMIQINVVHHSRDDHLYSFTLPGTDFIALTAYLNENITRLKISHNPFARAFKNKKISDVDVDIQVKKKKLRRKSRETPHVSYESTSSSGNSVMDGSMNHSLSSAGDIMRRKFMEGTTGGNGCLPMMCLLTSSGLYYQSLPYYRQDDRLTGPAIQSTYANKYMV